jgi:tetratricopeptide (TPR) repeat protein
MNACNFTAMNAQARIATQDAYARGLKLSAQGRHSEAIACFEQAHLAHPDDSHVLFALGNTARALDMPGPAETFFRRVLALEPGRMEALVSLANLLRANANPQGAAALLVPALHDNPECPELWLTMGAALREQNDMDGAKAHFQTALRHKPNYAAALANLADLIADEGDVQQALALYNHAIARAPQNAQMKLNRAILHFLTGNLKEGWRDYAARLKIEGKAPHTDHGRARWTGDTLKNKRLLVTAEQGVGDQMMFASMFPDLLERASTEGARIIVECEPRLVALFARSFPQICVHPAKTEKRGGRVNAHYDWLKAAGGANLAIEMGSLGRILRKDGAAFPAANTYLTVDAQEAAHWHSHFADHANAPYFGICWRSGKTGHGRALQYAPLEQWGAFLRDVPGTLVCAQYDADGGEIAILEELSGRRILRPENLDQKNELDRTAAMLSVLDMVIAAPTAVSWLAAATGTPVLKILYDTSWTSFGEAYEPFAPSCTCVMPDVPGDWAQSFANAKAIISKRFA